MLDEWAGVHSESSGQPISIDLVGGACGYQEIRGAEYQGMSEGTQVPQGSDSSVSTVWLSRASTDQ